MEQGTQNSEKRLPELIKRIQQRCVFCVRWTSRQVLLRNWNIRARAFSVPEAERRKGMMFFRSGLAVQPPAYKERSGISLFFTLMFGIAAGALAFWLLAVPAIKQEFIRKRTARL